MEQYYLCIKDMDIKQLHERPHRFLNKIKYEIKNASNTKEAAPECIKNSQGWKDLQGNSTRIQIRNKNKIRMYFLYHSVKIVYHFIFL